MVSFTMNWFGVAMHDMSIAAQFYSDQLGLSFQEDAEKDLWRYFETRRMVFELFAAHPERINVEGWGHGQNIRPVIMANDLLAVKTHLHELGIGISTDANEFGDRLEMLGPEGIRFSFIKSPGAEMDWTHPLVAGIELRVNRLEAQRDFYVNVLGMKVDRQVGQSIQLTQSNCEAWLRIEPGGTPLSLPAEIGDRDPAFFYPLWISFETPDAVRASDWLVSQNATILQPLTYHQDWGGTTIIIADIDGNAIEIVQYHR